VIRRLQITVLVENTAGDRDVLAEHGLSLLVEADNRRMLFDTGQGRAFLDNARRLGISVDSIDAAVLSHGHFDHTGGLTHLNAVSRSFRLFVHPEALAVRYGWRETPPPRPIGMPEEAANMVRQIENRVVWTTGPTRIMEDVWVTGPIPRRTDFEDTGGSFFLDAECTVPDPFADDQAVWLETQTGRVVLLGCAHSGTVNTLDHISELTRRQSIYAVIGGMHLIRADARRLRATAEALEQHDVQYVVPCHCTGDGAMAFLRGKIGDRLIPCATGSRLSLV